MRTDSIPVRQGAPAVGPTPVDDAPHEARWPRRVAVVAGTMMLGGAALNTVLVTAEPQLYPKLGT